MNYKLRWARWDGDNDDMREVMAIDEMIAMDHYYHWRLKAWGAYLHQNDTVLMLACQKDDLDEVLGFMAFRLKPRKLVVNKLAVHPAHRRKGVGTALIDNLVNKLNEKRPILQIDVCEYHLSAQLFLKKCGLRAKAMEQEEQDAAYQEYRFVYNMLNEAPLIAAARKVNNANQQ